MGLSVPPGFSVTTECCKQFCGDWNGKLPAALWKEILESVQIIEEEMDSIFGDPENPLLVSVRSGAAISMPGMMDTVLNLGKISIIIRHLPGHIYTSIYNLNSNSKPLLGMNDEVVEGLAKKSNNPRFAWDSYRRFLEMFGNVVLEIPRRLFEEEIDDIKTQFGISEDSDLTTAQLMLVVQKFKGVYAQMDLSFPDDVTEQLEHAIGAVFKGWMGDRAVKYREVENIRNLLGTAVNVQAMVFGNMGDTSGTGVCFTRNPNNGEKQLFGEFLVNAQGEDVVAGIRTPRPISELETVMPGMMLINIFIQLFSWSNMR